MSGGRAARSRCCSVFVWLFSPPTTASPLPSHLYYHSILSFFLSLFWGIIHIPLFCLPSSGIHITAVASPLLLLSLVIFPSYLPSTFISIFIYVFGMLSSVCILYVFLLHNVSLSFILSTFAWFVTFLSLLNLFSYSPAFFTSIPLFPFRCLLSFLTSATYLPSFPSLNCFCLSHAQEHPQVSISTWRLRTIISSELLVIITYVRHKYFSV